MNQKTLSRTLLLASTLLMALFSLSSCNRKVLSAHTEFIGVQDLASYYVNTPDPRLNHPPFGQRLVIGWSIPSDRYILGRAELFFTIRFYNREEVVRRVPVHQRHGEYLFCLNRAQFCKTGGILTYRIQLIADGCVLREFRHQLWSELIVLDIEEEEEVGEDFEIDAD